MSDLQAKFQAEAAEYKSIQKELQKVRPSPSRSSSPPNFFQLFPPEFSRLTSVAGYCRIAAARVAMQRKRSARPHSPSLLKSHTFPSLLPCPPARRQGIFTSPGRRRGRPPNTNLFFYPRLLQRAHTPQVFKLVGPTLLRQELAEVKPLVYFVPLRCSRARRRRATCRNESSSSRRS